jgi:hypothetical protein
MAQFNFDSSTVAPRENNYELLPAGDYVAQVTESAIDPLKSGNGQCLKLTVTVLQEGHNGRKIFCRLNVQHSNPQTEQIAQQQLRELCDAIGVVRMQDTTELHNKPFVARVKIRKSTDPQYTDQNEISGFKAATSGARPAAFAAPRAAAPAAAAPAAGGSTPPWAKK